MENLASHRQLVKLAHDVLQAHPKEQDEGALLDFLKWAVGRRHMQFGTSGRIAAALKSAQWQRRHADA